jgi:DNA ligase 1
MKHFAELLEALAYAPSRARKGAILARYLAAARHPDRGFALAALTDRLTFQSVKPALFKSLISQRIDPVLFGLSYDFVGDLAETISLCWPSDENTGDLPLGEAVGILKSVSRSDAPVILAQMLDRLEPSSRFALIKLATGGLRVGVSSGIVRQALSKWSGKSEEEIEDVWHVGEPPYTSLFNWLSNAGPKPETGITPRWRSFMLAHPLKADDMAKLDPDDFIAEWKWDGIRVQAISDGARTWLYSRSGDDITAAFPDIVLPEGFNGCLDGELLAKRLDSHHLAPGTFNQLQQRLNRKSPTAKLLAESPVFLRSYDLLFLDGKDLRAFATVERRRLLQDALHRFDGYTFDLSAAFDFGGFEGLDQLRQSPPDPAIEGIMLKRKDAPYVAGRPAGMWYKWKKSPLTADVVLMYAQRGHGKRSGIYSDFTFGAWTEDGKVLLPVGKAYSGFTDAELVGIDRYVRENTIERFGPVRSVKADAEFGLVFEIEFEGIGPSTRHKSGIALRFPRVSRLRFDKLPKDADTVASLKYLIK